MQLLESMCVTPINYSQPLIFQVDASESGYGAVLLNEDEDGRRVICTVMSLKWTGSEGGLSNPSRELININHATHYFHDLVFSTPILVETDSLTYLERSPRDCPLTIEPLLHSTLEPTVGVRG